MCTGRVDLSFITRAFARGADGVIVAGCWPGECHYVTEGNYDAFANVQLGKGLLERVGLQPERLRIEWVGASEGARYAEVMSDFARQVKALGPWRARAGEAPTAAERSVERLHALVPYIKLVQREKLRPKSRAVDVVKEFYASAQARAVIDGLIADKLQPPAAALPVTAPCQLGCPVGTEAWRYVAHIERGEYAQAYQAIREPNPFPSVCSRVCDHRCERACRLGQVGESPVAIRALKRFVTDSVDPAVFKPARAPERTQRVAVVGAGPAGLTAAHLLSLRGFRVTVFEESEAAGGMLRHAIPAYRLPRDVLDREIAALVDERVTLKLGVRLGCDLTLDGLLDDGFAAVFLAFGSTRSLPLKIEGEQAQGVLPSLQFLKEYNLRGRSLARGRVGIVGGGNSAIDAARIALRQPDVSQVTLLYRRTRDEMPAFGEEIDAAIAEGAELRTLLTPVRVETADGVLTGLTCQKNELGPPDRSGRRRPVPVAGTEHVVPLDTLIVAVSEAPDLDSLASSQAGAQLVQATAWGSVDSDARTLATSRPGVFAGGDAVTGPSTVIDAIAAGKRAARAIERFVDGEALSQPGDAGLACGALGLPPARAASTGGNGAARLVVPHLAVAERRMSAVEVEQGVHDEVARCEAARCLRCDRELDARA
jgi:heterodisulfide reductase subunit A